MANIISNDVRVSPIEYVTKYSLNRNFLRLIKNDEALLAEIESKLDKEQVHSYIPMRKYSEGECVFFKADQESLSLYLLCSEIDNNTYSPLVYVNSAGEKVVSSDSNWKIVGLPEGIDVNPKDYVREYLLSNLNDFLSSHQDNIDLSAHPTKELGINKSSVAFTSFENVDENRKTFFYPNQLASLNPDNSIIAGYMRKWDNGLLEYDILYRVGYYGDTDENGLDVISANVLDVYHRNKNNLYFNDDKDFKIFQQGDNHFVSVNKVKQVNLNTKLNSYYGEIKFPEPFKDLNYMIFTSNVKNIDTESYNLKDEPIKGTYDNRLIVEGLTLVGYQTSAEWEKPLKLPSLIKNIGNQALSMMKEVNDIEVIVTMLSDYELINIEDYAFELSDIRLITIPKNVRCIGAYAFNYCKYLLAVDIYVNADKSKLPIVDFGVFNGCERLLEINIHYYEDPVLFAATKELRSKVYTNELDIYEKFTDPDIRTLYGITNSVAINRYGEIPSYITNKNKLFKIDNLNNTLKKDIENIKKSENSYSINIKDFINKINDKLSIFTNIDTLKNNNLIIYDHSIFNLICSLIGKENITIAGNGIMDFKLSSHDLTNMTLSGFNDIQMSSISAINLESCIIIPGDEGIDYKSFSLANLSLDYLEIDLRKSYIEASAFIGSKIKKITFKNFSDSYIKPIVNRKGIGKESFLCSDIKNIDITDKLSYANLKNELSLNMISENNLNVPCLPDECIINNNMMKVNFGAIGAKPESDFLYIEDVGGLWTVISCKWEAIRDYAWPGEIIDILIPNGVQSIAISAFNRGIEAFTEYSPIHKITIPLSVLIIDDYAFANNLELYELNFISPNINLKKIGINIIKDCKSLGQFVIN